MSGRTRSFVATDEEYRALAALQHVVYPDYPFSAKEMRHEDETWDDTKFFKARWVLEDGGEMLGWAQVDHSRHSFVPATIGWMSGCAPTRAAAGTGPPCTTSRPAFCANAPRRVSAPGRRSP